MTPHKALESYFSSLTPRNSANDRSAFIADDLSVITGNDAVEAANAVTLAEG
jgi:hypothetical protein